MDYLSSRRFFFPAIHIPGVLRGRGRAEKRGVVEGGCRAWGCKVWGGGGSRLKNQDWRGKVVFWQLLGSRRIWKRYLVLNVVPWQVLLVKRKENFNIENYLDVVA